MTAAHQPPLGVQSAPGVSWSVVCHLPASGGVYLGSPSIVRLDDGILLASCDRFAPGYRNDTSWIHASRDQGRTWTRNAELQGQWWSTLFMHRNQPHLIGTTREYGDAVIRRSADGGRTWTTPLDADSGLLLRGRCHCAPQPVLIHRGRIWRAMEDLAGSGRWGFDFRAFMMSAPLESDLMRAENWTCSNRLPSSAAWLDGRCGGWLEGNAVAGPDGQVYDILRVDLEHGPEVAAAIRISGDGREASFDPAVDFVAFPGGAKKATIRHDPRSGRWWTIATPAVAWPGRPADSRNHLALMSSPDLRQWTHRAMLLSHPEHDHHGFQYVDWQFDGDDLLALCRTAADDGLGGAATFHDSNLITFHRVAAFRTLETVS